MKVPGDSFWSGHKMPSESGEQRLTSEFSSIHKCSVNTPIKNATVDCPACIGIPQEPRTTQALDTSCFPDSTVTVDPSSVSISVGGQQPASSATSVGEATTSTVGAEVGTPQYQEPVPPSPPHQEAKAEGSESKGGWVAPWSLKLQYDRSGQGRSSYIPSNTLREVYAYTQRHLLRIYPAAWKVDSR